MTRNQKIKLGSVFVILALSIWLLWPSFQSFGMNQAELNELKQRDPKKYNSMLDKSLQLGLDLQGGSYIVLEVDLKGIPTENQQSTVDQAVKILRNRVDQIGMREPSITKEGADRIVVELPGLDVSRARELISTTAQLEFKLVAQSGELISTLQKIDQALKGKDLSDAASGDKSAAAVDSLAAPAAAAAGDTAKEEITFLKDLEEEAPEAELPGDFSSLLHVDSYADRDGRQHIRVFVYTEDKPLVERYLADPGAKGALSQGFEFIWGREDVVGQDQRPARLLYLCNSRIELAGKSLTKAAPVPDNNSPGFYQVSFELDRKGADQFARVTERNVGRDMAIVLDHQVQSAPNIESRIGQGRGVITGRFTSESAYDLAIVLRSGALPTSMRIEEERTVGPSLGRDSIRKGFLAGILGFVGVVLFMMIYYRVSGVIASVVLIFNLVIVMAIMAYAHATLTLPGIAGLILTVGMAVDSNVLIYERIRDELRRGGREAKIRRAVSAGYERAFSAIFDSNLTTLITAAVLYVFGTGPIRGFAVTLSLGLVASMYTALLVSRIIFELLIVRRPVEKLSI